MISRLLRPWALILGLVVAIAAIPTAGALGARGIADSRPLPPALQEWLKVRSEPMVALNSAIIGGWTWSVVTPDKVPDGLSCDALKIPLPPGTFKKTNVPTWSISGTGCLPMSQLFWAGPVNEHHGWMNAGPAAAEWVWGQVSPQVKTVSVQLASCHVVSLPINHGIFLYVAPDSAPPDTTPVALIAKSSDGVTLETTSLVAPSALAKVLNGTPSAHPISGPSSC